ncbi:hypothetical protein PIB30_087921 [Stylosanthes scabra]|uniref:Uncharacterized protein n=1 Tax=Stylosanthes scabra TaxID=79078 RepID=A0ABU6QT31_9FABA|nr:hypothetical protein [Stylosanthes scabra]
MEEAYLYDQGYIPWNPPPYQHHSPRDDAYQSNGYGDAYYGYEDLPPPYLPSQIGIGEAIQLLCLERKELLGNQRQINAQVTTLQLSVICLMIESVNGKFNNSSITSQPLHSGDLPSQSLSNQWRSIPTLSLCVNQEGREDTLLSQSLSNQWRSIPTLFLYVNQDGREDALLNVEDVESLDHKEVHECVEEVEEENEDQEVEDIDQQVKDKDKEPKGMEIVHFASSEETPPKLPSELHFEWVNNPSNMNFIGPQYYGLLETDDQLRALGGVLNTKGMDSLVLDESRFITCGKSDFKAYSGYLHKLHNNRANVRALSMRKHLGPWQFQKKLVNSQNNGWTNRVWDWKKLHESHFW